MKFSELLRLVKKDMQPNKIKIGYYLFEWDPNKKDYCSLDYHIMMTQLLSIEELYSVDFEVVE